MRILALRRLLWWNRCLLSEWELDTAKYRFISQNFKLKKEDTRKLKSPQRAQNRATAKSFHVYFKKQNIFLACICCLDVPLSECVWTRWRHRRVSLRRHLVQSNVFFFFCECCEHYRRLCEWHRDFSLRGGELRNSPESQEWNMSFSIHCQC